MTKRPSRAAGDRDLDLVVQLVHDVRSPLTAVVAVTGSLRDEMEDVVSQRQRHMFNLIYNAALQLEYLVSDFIELTRPREELARLDLVPFSVQGALEGVRDVLQPLSELENAPISISVSVDPDYRLGQPAALGRVLLNLAASPLRNGDRGGVTLEASGGSGDDLKFVVRSEESPLEPAVIEQIRAVALGRHPRSTMCFSGLGLELAFYLADCMGAPLDVSSSPSGGTVYTMVLRAPPVPDPFPRP